MAASKSSWRSKSPNRDVESEQGATSGGEVVPREKTVGRFRLIPHSSKQFFLFRKNVWGYMTQNFLTSANYGPASPFLGRSRFSVIPEEPHGSPSQGATLTDKEPSPEWDFDDDKKVVSQTKISFSHKFYHLTSFTSFYAVCEKKS